MALVGLSRHADVPTDISTAGLDLERGRPAAVAAGERLLRTVQRLTDSQEMVTEALIASQDQLAALRALIGVPINSLDDNSSLDLMLTEARDLTNSHGAVLVRGGVMMDVGAGQELVELRQRLTCGKGLRRSEPHSV